MNYRFLQNRFFFVILFFLFLTSCSIIPLNNTGTPTQPETQIEIISPTEISPTPITAIPTKIQEPTPTSQPTNTIAPPSGELIYLTGGKIINHQVDADNLVELANLTGQIYGVSLTPDISTLAFTTNEGLTYLDLSTGEIIAFIGSDNNTILIPRGFNPRSFPGRSQLLVSKQQGDLYSFALVHQAPVLNWLDLPFPQSSNNYGCDSGVAWSSSGDNIVVSGINSSIPCNTNPGLTLISNRRGSTYQLIEKAINTGLSENDIKIAGTRTPTWSYDANTIYFSLDVGLVTPLQFYSQIYSIQNNGSGLTQISQNNRGIAAFPLSTTFGALFYSVNGDLPQTDGIYQYDLATFSNTLIIKGASLCPIALSQDGRLLLYGVVCYEAESAMEFHLYDFSSSADRVLVRSQDGKPIRYLGWKE